MDLLHQKKGRERGDWREREDRVCYGQSREKDTTVSNSICTLG